MMASNSQSQEHRAREQAALPMVGRDQHRIRFVLSAVVVCWHVDVAKRYNKQKNLQEIIRALVKLPYLPCWENFL